MEGWTVVEWGNLHACSNHIIVKLLLRNLKISLEPKGTKGFVDQMNTLLAGYVINNRDVLLVVILSICYFFHTVQSALLIHPNTKIIYY